LAEHTPPLQKLPLLHCASEVQAAGHEVDEPLHTYAPHVGEPGVPATTGLHVPTLPATLHASHAPPQAELQHTPSTHWPLPHWLAPVQEAPLVCLGTHTPPLQ
jgi:hypothetical protein